MSPNYNNGHKPLNGSLSRKTMSKRNNSVRCAARYLLIAKKKCTASECFINMKYKSGKLYRSGANSTSLRKLESRMSRHPVLQRYTPQGSPAVFTCTLEAYEEYFDDDPFYDWTDNKAVNRRPRNGTN